MAETLLPHSPAGRSIKKTRKLRPNNTLIDALVFNLFRTITIQIQKNTPSSAYTKAFRIEGPIRVTNQAYKLNLKEEEYEK